MTKRIFSGIILCCGFVFEADAQWTSADSLNLQRVLNGNDEIRINKSAVRQIDFGSFLGSPEIVDDEPGLKWDSNLPKLPIQEKNVKLTLKPYTARTPFNYDPIREVKIKVGPSTWCSSTAPAIPMQFVYSNWAKKPTDKGPRNSLEQIEATGLRYNPIAERANNMAVGSWGPSGGGGGIGGMDFNAVFTREFWDKSVGKRRSRTLEVLRTYGDSITTEINNPLQQITK